MKKILFLMGITFTFIFGIFLNFNANKINASSQDTFEEITITSETQIINVNDTENDFFIEIPKEAFNGRNNSIQNQTPPLNIAIDIEFEDTTLTDTMQLNYYVDNNTYYAGLYTTFSDNSSFVIITQEQNIQESLLLNLNECMYYKKIALENSFGVTLGEWVSMSISEYGWQIWVNDNLKLLERTARATISEKNLIIEQTLSGLGSIFTIYIPTLTSALINTISQLFIDNGNGTAVLGIVIVAVGIAIITSLLHLALRLLKIKKKL